MQFANYSASFLFWVVLGLLIFYIWAFKAREKAVEMFVQKHLIESILNSYSAKKARFKTCILLFVCLLFIIALMRPQWGYKLEEIKRKGVDIVIALDVSKSMLAEDIKPNRLERSKLAIADMLKNLQGDRAGLIAFAGSAFIQCPLTNDYNGFLLSLEDMNVNVIPKGGTSLSSAIKESLRGFKGAGKKYRALIIISDGEDHDGGAEEAAKEAQKEGVKIYCIGIGSPVGELITITDDAGNKSFFKDNQDRVVKSRLNEALLQKIAFLTDGSYVRSAAAEFGLNTLYSNRISKMEKQEFQAKMKKRYYERYQIPLAIALILLLIEPFISERKNQWA